MSAPSIGTATVLLMAVALGVLAASCGGGEDSTPVTVTPTTAADAFATTVPMATTTQASYSTTTTAAAYATTTAPPTTTVPPATTTTAAASGVRTVTVEAGDSLSKIAKAHGMTVERLAALNAICDINQLFVGQVLLLGEEQPEADPDAAPTGVSVTVQAGDSVSKIAKRYDTTVDAILADNDISDPNLIFVGQTLVITTAAEPAAPMADPCVDG
ncbi:MAG: LysM peptidoglycan-binding domain-containing protein [Acidimicrobiales bacterium]|nr:LysM peptidoglycan-binding domain-containing protein [Acidimicrobiales bacterium]